MRNLDELMLDFLQIQYPNVISAKIQNRNNILNDYYIVKCKVKEESFSSTIPTYDEHDRTCRVCISEFNKFKRQEEAIIWE